MAVGKLENFCDSLKLRIPEQESCLVMEFFQSLCFPLGQYCHYGRSGNSNGKYILHHLIKLAILCSLPSGIPGTYFCKKNRNLLFKIHVLSTRLLNQPSSVQKKGKERTQEILVSGIRLCVTGVRVHYDWSPRHIGTELLQDKYPKMPLYIVADADQMPQSRVPSKISELQSDLKAYKRSTLCKNMGILLNGHEIRIMYCNKENMIEYDRDDVYNLVDLKSLYDVILLINKLIHNEIESGEPAHQILARITVEPSSPEAKRRKDESSDESDGNTDKVED
jgi:hypothetical protein